MKQTLQIMANFDKPDLLKDMVERIAGRRNQKPEFSDRETIETSSTEAYVCGTVYLNEQDINIRMPFDSSFLFSCIRGINGEFEVTWSASMS